MNIQKNWQLVFPLGEHPKRVAATVLHSKCHILLYSSAARYIDLIRLLKSRFSDTITDKILHLFAKPMNILGEIASILLDRHCYYDKKTIKCTFTTIVQLLEENNWTIFKIAEQTCGPQEVQRCKPIQRQVSVFVFALCLSLALTLSLSLCLSLALNLPANSKTG